jgi:hypothetical protein
MNHLRWLALAAAALALGACSNPQDANLQSDTIVVTAGHVAHDDATALRTLGVLHATTLAGSTTAPLAVNGAACSTFDPVTVTIGYHIAGDLASAASFDVHTSWAYDGTGFVGSAPVTVEVPAGGSPIPSVDIRVSSSTAAGGSGSAVLRVVPFNVVTDTSVQTSRQLQTQGAHSDAVVNVTFANCSAINTPPALTVPADVTVIATGIDGASVGYVVTAQDAQDGDLTASVACTAADDSGVDRSGGLFPIGVRTVDCTVTDRGGLTTSASFVVDVTLDVDPNCGFLAPLRPSAPYSAHALNSTVPHKVCPPAYRDGTPAADLASGLHFVLQRRPLGDTLADPVTVAIDAAGSTAWRWDAAAGHYVYNLKTSRTWSRGDYETAVSYNGVVLAHTFFVLR